MSDERNGMGIDKEFAARKLAEAIKYYKKHGNIEKYDKDKLNILAVMAGYSDFDSMLHDWKLQNGEETYSLQEGAAKKLGKAIDQLEDEENLEGFDKADLDLWSRLANYENFEDLYSRYKDGWVSIRFQTED